MTQLALASFVFVALHILPAIRARDWLIRRIGDPAYMGLFSLASGLGLAWMIYAYANAPASEPLWVSGPALKWATAITMLFAFVLLVTANTSPNPTAVQGKGALKTRRQWTNIFAVTRHPLMWSIAIWAGLHLLNRPDATSALFFGPLAFLAIAGRSARKRASAGNSARRGTISRGRRRLCRSWRWRAGGRNLT